jgi:hypothetical protein
MIRKCVQSDMPWVVEVAHKCFPDFNESGGVEAFKKLMGSDQVFLIRGDHGWALAFMEKTPWLNHVSTFVEFVAIDKSRKSVVEMTDILKHIKELGEKQGATKMRLAALDVIGDLGCFVKRLNGRQVGKLWEV